MLEETIEESVTVTPLNTLEVKAVTVITKDGEILTRTPPHRHVVNQGDDLTNESDKVKAMASAVWS